jgi:hypothetical protein
MMPPRDSNRIRMYWEGSQRWRPDERSYALHRNGYAGMAHYGAFLWSRGVYSRWETLKTHIPVAVNSGLSGMQADSLHRVAASCNSSAQKRERATASERAVRGRSPSDKAKTSASPRTATIAATVG